MNFWAAIVWRKRERSEGSFRQESGENLMANPKYGTAARGFCIHRFSFPSLSKSSLEKERRKERKT